MFDEITLFNLIKQETADRTCVELNDVHLGSSLIEDLGLDDEDVDAVIAAIQSIILADEDIIGSHEVRECQTVSDLVDLLISLS